MPPAFPFPRIQAPAKAETGDICPDCEVMRLPGALCPFHASFGILREPRAFGWCGCTEAQPCHEHERRTK